MIFKRYRFLWPQFVRQAGLVVLAGMMIGIAVPISAQARAPLVQSVDVEIPMAPAVVAIAGRKYLVYELHITNFRPFDVALNRVEVLDPDRQTRVVTYGDSELAARMGRPGAASEPANKLLIGGGMRAVMYMWISLDPTLALPLRLQHRIELDHISTSGIQDVIVESTALDVRKDPPVILQAPLRGGPWVGLYDPMMQRGHRTSIYTIQGRARIPARFAIDWILLDEHAGHAKGDDSKIANWHGYGKDVLAVADATVADFRDDIAEQESISGSHGPTPLENASGNYVALELGNGQFAFYEHLKHGSIRVKAGDRVKAGQVIGQLGNSGSSSSGPHLHFHVSDAASTLEAEGIPYVFKSFEVVGAFESIDAQSKGERWKSAPNGEGRTRVQELPAPNVVVTFPSN